MKKLENPAILVVDMLNDFVTGALACDRGKAIVTNKNLTIQDDTGTMAGNETE